jgi:hypothetical protein
VTLMEEVGIPKFLNYSYTKINYVGHMYDEVTQLSELANKIGSHFRRPTWASLVTVTLL